MSCVVSLPACDSPSDPLLPRLHVFHVLLEVLLPLGSGKWGGTVEKPGPVKTQGRGREDSWSLWVSGCVWRRGSFQPASSLRDCRHWGVFLGGHIFSPPVCTQAERSSFEAGCFGCKGSKLGSCVCVSGSSAISTGLRGDSAKISSLCCLKLNPNFKKKIIFGGAGSLLQPVEASSSCGPQALEHVGLVVVARSLRCPAGCGVLVPRPGLKPVPSAVKHRALTAGPPGKSSLHFMMRACSARCDRLFPTSQPHLLPPSPGPATLALPSNTSGPWLLLSFWNASPSSLKGWSCLVRQALFRCHLPSHPASPSFVPSLP